MTDRLTIPYDDALDLWERIAGADWLKEDLDTWPISLMVALRDLPDVYAFPTFIPRTVDGGYTASVGALGELFGMRVRVNRRVEPGQVVVLHAGTEHPMPWSA